MKIISHTLKLGVVAMLWSKANSFAEEPLADRVKTAVIGAKNKSIAFVNAFDARGGHIGVPDSTKPRALDYVFELVRPITDITVPFGKVTAGMMIETRWGGNRSYRQLKDLFDAPIWPPPPKPHLFLVVGSPTAKSILEYTFLGPFNDFQLDSVESTVRDFLKCTPPPKPNSTQMMSSAEE